MPLHPDITVRLHLLEGIDTFEQAFADPELRARLEAFDSYGQRPPTPPGTVRDDAAPGPHGPVPVRVYAPPGDGSMRPALVWVHGGGFAMGDLDMPEADWVARTVAARADAIVVSVDYRLAVGGVTYPVPHDDVVAAVRWVRGAAAPLGIEPARISVGGASAGANLAAGAALRLRDDDGWLPAALIPVYPIVHPVIPPPTLAVATAMAEVPELFRFRPESVNSICTNYVGGPISRADGYAMPTFADLTGLCRTVIINAEYDDLRSSGEAFAAQLALASVDVRQVLVRGVLHGFLNMPDLAPTDRTLQLIASVVSGAEA